MIRAFFLFIACPLILASSYTVSMTPSCPYYCTESPKLKGYIVDILESFFTHKKLEFKVISTPYARVSDNILRDKSDFGVLSALDLRDDSNLSTVNTPLGFRTTGALSRKQDNIVILENLDLKNKKILLPIGSKATENIVKEMIAINKGEDLVNEITGSNVHNRLIDLIAIKRGDIALDDYNVMKYSMTFSQHVEKLTLAPTSLTGHNAILIVTKKKSKLKTILENELQNYLKKIRKSGELASILDKYSVSDWDRTSSR